ncbi:unnamed protein product [Symbiodinium sp. CCMP2456]|nr:unnamed protein product [Symbiodinium sp. CCMP2456]
MNAWQLPQSRICGVGPHSTQIGGARSSGRGWQLGRESPTGGSLLPCSSAASSVVLASVSRKAFRGRRYRCKCEASPGCVSGAMKLLVDADSHSVEEIKDVINRLEETGKVVYTTVFAEPRRINNKKWSQFFQDRKVTFQPVQRNPSRVGEANDDVIDRAIRTCDKGQSLALLTSDLDFSEAIKDATDTGKRVVVFVPSKMLTVIERFRRMGVEVEALPRRVSVFPRVRAILRADGNGHVQLGDECRLQTNTDTAEACKNMLGDLGYFSPTAGEREWEYLVHSTTKFWLTNELGSITVFPPSIGITQVLDQMRGSGSKSWRRYSDNMAFFLRKSATDRRLTSKTQIRKFGTGVAKALFMGGGPFLLNDSTNLVYEALRRLGYMDNDMNTNLREAMLVFVNVPSHKHKLRKQLDSLPTETDTAAEVEDKLRHAFLSHLTDGQWRLPRRDVEIRKRLRKEGFLADTKAARRDVFGGMVKYARRHQLPEMKTYNGYVFRLLYHMDSSPNKTGAIEIMQ